MVVLGGLKFLMSEVPLYVDQGVAAHVLSRIGIIRNTHYKYQLV